MTALDWRTQRRGPYKTRPSALDSITPESRKIIDQLVRARHEAGMTQAEVGKRIGQRHHYVSEIERGIFEAPLAVVARYARAVDLPWIEVR